MQAFAPGGAYHSLSVGQPLLLVFGGASVNDMLRNWALHVQKLQVCYMHSTPMQTEARSTTMSPWQDLRDPPCVLPSLQLPYVVTCMDESLFQLAGEHGLPAAMFKQGHEAAGPGVVTTRWKYFRMDPRAFMTMGILKVSLVPVSAANKNRAVVV
eukprot:scaffold17111_cov36-Tisochrysis_lutea.AAC.4